MIKLDTIIKFLQMNKLTMKKIISLLLIVGVLVLTSLALQAQPLPYASQQLIVKFKPNTTSNEQAKLLAALGAKEIQHFRGINVYLWQIPSYVIINNDTFRGVPAFVDYLNKQAEVQYAEPNYQYELLVTPNDPLYNQTWGMNPIQASDAWSITTGSSNVVVGVIDTGIGLHPDLVDNIWQNLGEDADGDGRVLEYIAGAWVFDPGDQNGIDDDGNGYADDFIGWDFFSNDNTPQDGHSHGTHCSGTVAAVGNNGIGVAGVAWTAQIMGLKIFSDSGQTYGSAILNAIHYSIINNVPITSNSWGGGGYSQALSDMISLAEANNQLFVAAAGNDNNNNDVNPFYPASYSHNNIITVGASNQFDTRSFFSNYGSILVDVFAPGSGILSTVPFLFSPSGYDYKSGTSMATPHVSGLAALILSQCPSLSYADIKAQIIDNVDVLPAFTGKCVSNGRINAYAALSNSTCCDVVAGFSMPVPICENTAFNFSNASLNTTSYLWDFGDGNTSTTANPLHTYTSAGTYTISLTASDGFCSDVSVSTIVVAPSIDASFISNINGLYVDFYANSTIANSYSWTVDGVGFGSSVNTSYTFSNTGTYEVCLEVTGVCGVETFCEDIVLMLSCNITTGLSLEWGKNYGGTLDETRPEKVIETSDGGFVFIARAKSSDIDLSTNYGGNDWWIVKVDALGQIEWQKVYGGSQNDNCFDIIQTADGGYMAVGATFSSDGDITLNKGSSDCWVVKMDSDGDIEWQQTYGGSSGDTARGVHQTADGSYIVSGYISSPDGDVSVHYGSADYWVFKLDALGNLIWERTYGGSNADYHVRTEPTNDNGYVLIGHTLSNNGDVTGLHGTNYDCWVIKIDGNGNLEWQHALGTTGGEFGHAIKQTNDGGYIAALMAYTNNPAGSSDDYGLIKLDEFGNIEWENTYGGGAMDAPFAVELYKDGFLVVGFSFASGGDVSENAGENDIWIIYVNNFGQLIWEESYGGVSNDTGRDIVKTSDGGIMVVGGAKSNTGGIPGNYGEGDIFLMKFNIFSPPLPIEWTNHYGGSLDELRPEKVIETNDGGFVFIARSQSSDIDLSLSYGGNDWWIVKVNVLGQIEWQKVYGGSQDDNCFDIIQTADGGYMAVGATFSSDGDITLNKGSSDCWVIKMDSDGDLEWQQTYGGSSGDTARGVHQTTDGGYVVSGYISSSDGDVSVHYGSADYWVFKLDAVGNLIWERTYGGSKAEYHVKTEATSDNGYILVGHTLSNDGDVTGLHGTHYDCWVAKIDSNGNLEWQHTFGSINGDYGRDIKQTNDGGYILAFQAYTSSPIGSSDDYAIVKLDALGNEEWTNTFGGGTLDAPLGIELYEDGFLVVGYSTSAGGHVSENFGDNDMWVIALDNVGQLVWEQSFGGAGWELARDVVRTSDGGFIIVGDTESTDGDFPSNHGLHDIVLIKLSAETASFSASNNLGCVGESLTFINTSTTINASEWLINNNTVSTSTDLTHIFTSPGDYIVTLVTTSINGCQDTYSELITISSSCVWPGDCNNDGIVDYLDYLAIGLAFNYTGFARIDNTIDFTPKYSEDWPTSFTDALNNGSNHKYADSGGGGSINFADTTAVIQNFGLTHPVITSSTTVSTFAEAIITPVINNPSLIVGQSNIIDLNVSSIFTQAGLSFYGAIVEVSYIGSNPQINFNNSCLGTLGTDFMATYRVDETNKKIKVALTRINHQNALCNGNIAQLIVVIDEMPIGGDAEITTENALIVDNEGVFIPTGGDSAQFTVYSVLDVSPTFVQGQAMLQGNPVSEYGLLGPNTTMPTTLRDKNLLPPSQPFNTSPWNYTGTEAVANLNVIPTNAVDWLLLEIQDASFNTLEQKAAFLLNDGNMVGVNGNINPNGIAFNNLQEGESYYLVIRSRNHLDVISSSPIQVQNGLLKYNFTTAAEQAMGAQQIELAPGVYGMYIGDINGDGVVSNADFNQYKIQTAQINQYTNPDLNMDGNVTITDFNLYLPNASLIGVPPIRY